LTKRIFLRVLTTWASRRLTTNARGLIRGIRWLKKSKRCFLMLITGRRSRC